MALQISTFTNEEESSPAFRNGFVLVDGEAVTARFHFGKCHGCDVADAERQARQFAAAEGMLALLKKMMDEHEDHPSMFMRLWEIEARGVIANAEGRV